jgi:hypothetical protein
MAGVTMYEASTEYLHIEWQASVALDQQTVEFAFLTGKNPVPDSSTTWQTGEWEGDASITRTARLLVGPGAKVQLPTGKVAVFTRLHDSPEVPVRESGVITVT